MNIATTPISTIRQQILGGTAPILIDVRTSGEFARFHAPTAHSLPLGSITPAAIEPLRSADDFIYLICQAGTRAATACRQLQNAGVRDLRVVEGGMAAWTKAGLPTVRSGGGAISLERQVRITAGSLVVLGGLLSWLVHPLFLLLSIFIGAGLIFAGISDFCGMGILLSKLPWNTQNASSSSCCSSTQELSQR